MRRQFLGVAVVILAICGVRECTSRAHHKVHNLALYPERHSWCQATPIRQEIASTDPDCSPTTIDNVVCLGACFSYAVPRAQDDVLIEPYCDACRPTHASWTVVSLNCTKAATGERYFATKNVELIANCSCVDCNSGARSETEDDDYSTVEEDNEESQEHHDENDGDSLSVLHRTTHHHHTHSAKSTGDDQKEGEKTKDTAEPSTSAASSSNSGPQDHLRSASAELKSESKAEEDLMIKDNKISPDDDDDGRHGK